MKRKLLAVILLLSLLLGGCSLRLNSPEALIRPPKPYGKNKGLQEALEAGIGSKRYTLEAPVQGEYRSAYILFDIDGDGEEEALVFYRMGTSSNGQIKMNILDREDGKWVSKYNISGQGTDVNQVVFSYMSGKQVPEILVSWKLFDTQDKNLLSVLRCSYDSNHTLRMSSIQQMEYTRLAVADLNKDGLDELLLLDLMKNDAVPSAMATLYRMNDNVQLEKLGETKMDGSVTSYESVQVEDGYKISGNPRVYVDGLKGEAMMVTEILYWDEKEKILRAPLYDAKTQAAMLMARSKNFTCRDINNDGVLEIPRQYPMAGADILLSQEKEGVTLTQWVRLEEATLVPVALTAVNAASFYMFTLPEQWKDMVYIKNDAESRTWTFYVWDHENQRLGQELLSIATVSKSSWSKKPLEGYTEIKVNQNLVYAAKIGKAQNLPTLTYQQVEANLQIFE